MGKVRVAIIGVGNCASSFVQGLHYYRNAKEDERVPGIMHVNLGGYHIRDVEIVAAIDIDKNKVGKDLADAIVTWPNNTYVFAKVPKSGVIVQRGMTHDGLGKYLSKIIQKAPGSTVDIVQLLKDTRTDVVVNYLPVGSEEATKWYVEQVLEAGCGFVNCIPVFIAREKYWQERFEKRGLPVIGDDIKSQVGATITHRVLSRLFVERGVRIDRMYQINFGGNTDFLNMLERERLESKKISKTSAVTSIIPYPVSEEDIHVGPSDYIPWLKDRKWCHIRMEGTTFGDVPLNLEMKLEVWDSPNSAGVVIDAVRCARLGLDHSSRARWRRRRRTSRSRRRGSSPTRWRAPSPSSSSATRSRTSRSRSGCAGPASRRRSTCPAARRRRRGPRGWWRRRSRPRSGRRPGARRSSGRR